MYKLSEVLKAKYDLQSLDINNVNISLDNRFNELASIIDQFSAIANNGKAKREMDFLQTSLNAAANHAKELVNLSKDLDKNLDIEFDTLHEATVKKYENVQYFDSNADLDYIEHRKKWGVSAAINSTIAGLIGQYVDFKLPIAYIEPNTNSLLRYLVAGDPFYYIDNRELPYKNALRELPRESKNKIFHYTYEEANDYLEPESVGLSISWQNFPFKNISDIQQEINSMVNLTLPGGYIMFDYVDGNDYKVAKAIEDGLFYYQWKEHIYKLVNDAGLEIIQDVEFLDFMPRLLICKKPGNLPTLNINNKLGLVMPDVEVLNQKRQVETEINQYYKSMTSKIKSDIKKLQDRDKLLNALDEERRINPTEITKQKLKSILNNLSILLNEHESDHIAVLEAILNASKLTHNIGRHKDSVNLIKRVRKTIDKLDPESDIVKKYRDWIEILNNN